MAEPRTKSSPRRLGEFEALSDAPFGSKREARSPPYPSPGHRARVPLTWLTVGGVAGLGRTRIVSRMSFRKPNTRLKG